MPQVDFTEDELLVLAVIRADEGDLKPEYAAIHVQARQKCVDAYVGARKNELYPSADDEDPPTLQLARRVAVEESAIRDLLAEAANNGSTLILEYRDRNGDRTARRIVPSGRGVFKSIYRDEYFAAHDLDKMEMRTFRVDRVERLELV